MKDNTRLLVTIGFLTVLVLMFSLVAIALLQLQKTNESMEYLVERTNKKTAAAHAMRDAIRLRANSLKTMQLTNDIFERDAESLRLISHAGKYRRARERLVSLGMDEQETLLHEQLQQLARTSQPYNDLASELLMSDASPEQLESVIRNAVALQRMMLDKLEELVAIELRNTEEALAASRAHYRTTRQLLIALSMFVLLFSVIVARTVIRHVSAKNRQLTYQASHDALTGLINRREFEVRLDRAIRVARAQSGAHALLYVDLDQFKIVNDTCGHAAGDELLQQLSGLLLSSVRYRDTLSRLGGDEFGMLLENCPLDKAVSIANDLLKIMDSFQFTWNDNIFTLGMSIGVVPIDRTTTDIAMALSAADSACYIAKEAGRNRVQIAHLGDRRLQERHGEMQWVSRLTRALEEKRFELFYQPIIPCARRNNGTRLIEVLLRLLDDDGTIIAPTVFMPAAEKYNLAANIDRWVIATTLEWIAANSGDGNRPLTVFINISGQTVGSADMLRFIIDKMDETGVSPEMVVFEITETTAITNITSATSFMLTLKGCGFRFSLDDFGSGLYSFTYLKKLPIDFLKIDGTFVRDALSDPVDYAMVRSINELGQLLGKETIAEFVESLEIADELRNIGVDYVQGYAYSKPLPLHDFTHTMRPHLVVITG
ncbi:MAG: EAL domain-containing protein [Gammaproteobacteria bacterium]|nr:EAL domain-containing protein [Gammaproteobacteria bacterium]